MASPCWRSAPLAYAVLLQWLHPSWGCAGVVSVTTQQRTQEWSSWSVPTPTHPHPDVNSRRVQTFKNNGGNSDTTAAPTGPYHGQLPVPSRGSHTRAEEQPRAVLQCMACGMTHTDSTPALKAAHPPSPKKHCHRGDTASHHGCPSVALPQPPHQAAVHMQGICPLWLGCCPTRPTGEPLQKKKQTLQVAQP